MTASEKEGGGCIPEKAVSLTHPLSSGCNFLQLGPLSLVSNHFLFPLLLQWLYISFCSFVFFLNLSALFVVTSIHYRTPDKWLYTLEQDERNFCFRSNCLAGRNYELKSLFKRTLLSPNERFFSFSFSSV